MTDTTNSTTDETTHLDRRDRDLLRDAAWAALHCCGDDQPFPDCEATQTVLKNALSAVARDGEFDPNADESGSKMRQSKPNPENSPTVKPPPPYACGWKARGGLYVCALRHPHRGLHVHSDGTVFNEGGNAKGRIEPPPPLGFTIVRAFT